jgi:hypothetical protein
MFHKDSSNHLPVTFTDHNYATGHYVGEDSETLLCRLENRIIL